MVWPKSALPRKLLHDLKASYWFIPAAMTLAALGAAVVTETLDRQGLTSAIPELFYSTHGDAARSVLAVIAQAAIGAAGVMFSMTIVAVTFASANFGPRLIGNFMQDRGVQVSLGTLLATFVFALLILRGVRSAEDGFAYVPALSMTVALGLALLSVMVLIYFVHHIPEHLSLENVTARLGRKLLAAIERLPAPAERVPLDPVAPDTCVPIHLGVTGYVQAVNSDGILQICKERGLTPRVLLWPGDFAAPHKPVVLLEKPAELDDETVREVRSCFAVGIGRTEAQNPTFLAQQLTEIITRALSPGVNDPVTAITCLNWLHAALHAVTRHGPVDPTPSIYSPNLSFGVMMDVAHRFPRSYIAADVSVTLHAVGLLDTLIDALADGPRRRRAIEERADLVSEAQAACGDSPEIAALAPSS